MGNDVSSSFLGGMLGSCGPVLGTPRQARPREARAGVKISSIKLQNGPNTRRNTSHRTSKGPEKYDFIPQRPRICSVPWHATKGLKNHVFRVLFGQPHSREAPGTPNNLRVQSGLAQGPPFRVLQGRRIARALQTRAGPHPMYPVFAAWRVTRERVRPLWSATTAES